MYNDLSKWGLWCSVCGGWILFRGEPAWMDEESVREYVRQRRHPHPECEARPLHSDACKAVYEAACEGREHPGDDYTCPACPWPPVRSESV